MTSHTSKSLLFLFSWATICARVPENLAGTDLFPDSIDVTVDVVVRFDTASKSQIIEPRHISLPTKALNLSYGAECFSTCLQPIYQYGEIIEQATITIPGRAGTAKDVIRYNFFADATHSTPILYEQTNPLVVLTRALFLQVSGSTSLGDFRLAPLCIGKKTEEERIRSWAIVVATALLIYEIKACDFSPAQTTEHVNKLNKILASTTAYEAVAKMQTNLFAGATKQVMLANLLYDCILRAETDGLGADFPLRILMGGVYLLFGSNQEHIFSFYQQLKDQMYVRYNKAGRPYRWEQLVPLLDPIVIPGTAGASIPAPFEKGSEVDVSQDSYCAFRLLKQAAGTFNPIPFEKAVVQNGEGTFSFPDCVETVLRNIALLLLLKKDGGIQKGIAIAPVDAFFEKYPKRADQDLVAAHNEWGKLISAKHGVLYNHGFCNLRASLANILCCLNYLFGLNIEQCTSHAINLSTGNGDFIREVLPLVNEQLRAKLGLEHDPLVIDGLSSLTDIPGVEIHGTINGLTILGIMINPGKHSEIKKTLDEKQITHPIVNARRFPFLERAIFNIPGVDNYITNITLITETLNTQEFSAFLNSFSKSLADKHSIMRTMLFCKALDLLKNNLGYGIALIKSFIKKINFIPHQSANAIANQCTSSSDNNLQCLGLALLSANLPPEGDFTAPIALATSKLSSDNPIVSKYAVKFFCQLVSLDKGYEEALAAATTATQRDNPKIQKWGLRLFIALMDKGRGADDAFAAINRFLTLDDPGIQKWLPILFIRLVRTGRGYEEAIIQAKKAIESSVEDNKIVGCNLYRTLITADQAFSEATAAAEALAPFADNPLVFRSLISLLQALVLKNQSYSLVSSIGKHLFMNTPATSKDAVLKIIPLFDSLVAKNEGLGDARDIVTRGMTSPYPEVRTKILALEQKLPKD